MLGIEAPGAVPKPFELKALTPGDFVNVYRQARLMPAAKTAEGLAHLLAQEQRGKPGVGLARRIGFV